MIFHQPHPFKMGKYAFPCEIPSAYFGFVEFVPKDESVHDGEG
jgi:hypothetical protein